MWASGIHHAYAVANDENTGMKQHMVPSNMDAFLRVKKSSKRLDSCAGMYLEITDLASLIVGAS